MNILLALHVLGVLLFFLGGALLVPVPVSLIYDDGQWPDFAIPAAGAMVLGALMYWGFRTREEMTLREGFGVTTFGWILFSLVGSIPYMMSGALPRFVDAFFESMSGFTTTGATVIADLGTVAPSVLFWRSMSQWLGGMGIIVLSLAILPFLGIGGMQLYSAEVPGVHKDKLSSKVQDTAKVLWAVYFALTALLCVLLAAGGVSWFSAINHAFTTMATGGFSIWNDSIGHYSGPYVHWVITLFMFLAGVNFSMHFRALRRPLNYFDSDEFIAYFILVLSAMLVTFGFIWPGAGHPVEPSLRAAAFQVVSIGTTTGYGTADYELWPVLPQYLLFLMMFIGGSAGSTAGGMKVIRILLLIKQSIIQVFRLIHPKGVKYMMLDHKAVPLNAIQGVMGFFVLNAFIVAIASLAVAAVGGDFLTAATSVVTCLFNVGPGFGEVGPTDNFAAIHPIGKLVLMFCMLVGRLELFTVLVLFIPSFWRK